MSQNRCVTYVRVSQPRQEQYGFSVQAQTATARGYADLHNYDNVREFVEAETASKEGREQFNAMIEYLSQPDAPRIVLVEKTDRMERNFYDEIKIDRLIKERDVEFHYIKEGVVMSQRSPSHVRLMHDIKIAIAKNFSENLSEEVRKGNREKAMAGGWGGPAPYGYENDKVNKTIFPHPDRSHFVRTAFYVYATGLYSLEAAAIQLKQMGYIYQPYRPKISANTLKMILTNPVYMGDIIYKGEAFKGIHDPLVDLATWNAVQEVIVKRSKPIEYGHKEFLYKGLATCGECGQGLVGELKKGGRYTYYRCSSLKKNGCSQGYINQVKLDAEIDSVINTLEVSDECMAEIAKMFEQTDDMLTNTTEDEIASINRQLTLTHTNLKKAYLDKLSGVIDEQTYLEFQQDHTDQRRHLEERLHKLTESEQDYFDLVRTGLELPKKLKGVWPSATEQEKRPMLNFITSNLSVKDGNIDVTLTSLFELIYTLGKDEKWYARRDSNSRLLPSEGSTLSS